MYARIRRLTSGIASGVEIAERLQTDLLPVYEAAEGFVSYTVIGTFANGVHTLRVFQDQASMEAVQEASQAASEQMTADLEIDADDEDIAGEVLFEQRA